jgi:putative ABC transport system substrate-binding protein
MMTMRPPQQGQRFVVCGSGSVALGLIALMASTGIIGGMSSSRARAMFSARFGATKEAAAALGLRLVSLAASTPEELRALRAADLTGSDALAVLADGMFWNQRATVVALAQAAGLPAIYPEREYADDNGLIAYGTNIPDCFRRAAGYVDRILGGAKPGDLPIDEPAKFDFVVNLRTAHAMGITISPDFLSTANEVIE